jgi:hypothetical protein
VGCCRSRSPHPRRLLLSTSSIFRAFSEPAPPPCRQQLAHVCWLPRPAPSNLAQELLCLSMTQAKRLALLPQPKASHTASSWENYTFAVIHHYIFPPTNGSRGRQTCHCACGEPPVIESSEKNCMPQRRVAASCKAEDIRGVNSMFFSSFSIPSSQCCVLDGWLGEPYRSQGGQREHQHRLTTRSRGCNRRDDV